MVKAAERITFETRTPQSYSEILRGYAGTPAAAITGDLFLPAGAARKVPVVVTSIGSHGLTSGREELYAEALTGAGFAMFIVDSYTARGFTETISDQGKLSMAASVTDAMFAIRRMAADARVDARKIALMGYSRGGATAVQGWDERIRQAALGDLRPVAHVGLYPPCYQRWRHPQPVNAPLLMLFGGADELAREDRGMEYAAVLRAAGGDVTTVTYPGLQHSFDANYAAKPNPQTMNLSASRIMIEDDGDMSEDITGLRAGGDWAGFLHAVGARLGVKGAVTGNGPGPRDVAVKAILEFLGKAFAHR